MDAAQVLSADLQSVPLLDESILAQVRDIPGLFDEIVKSVQEKITKLQMLRHEPAFTQETLKTFGDTAHSLKSGMSVVGCSRLSVLCYKIGKSGPVDFLLRLASVQYAPPIVSFCACPADTDTRGLHPVHICLGCRQARASFPPPCRVHLYPCRYQFELTSFG
eukprot:m.72652 g.72652  ORF g.72652 m.72652 type:complete len:163 (-) comp13865_c0_seq1:917-1405(-)